MQQSLQNGGSDGAARQRKLRVLEACELEVVMLVLMLSVCGCGAVRVVFMWSVVCDGVFMHIELNCRKLRSDCLSAYVETCGKNMQKNLASAAHSETVSSRGEARRPWWQLIRWLCR